MIRSLLLMPAGNVSSPTHAPVSESFFLADSAKVTTAAPNMMMSLIISRPAIDKYGNPCAESPSAGTHASGVVTRNDSVVRLIKIRRKLPTAAKPGAKP